MSVRLFMMETDFMNRMIIIGLIMVGVGVVLMLFAHKMNEQNPRLAQYLAMTFLLLFLWGCALMIWGSGGYLPAVVFAALGTALPLYCLRGMKGTENMSDDELKEYIEDGQTTHMVECVSGNPEENGMRYLLRYRRDFRRHRSAGRVLPPCGCPGEYTDENH